MNTEERAALEAVQFNSALTPDDIWSPVRNHVDGLHRGAASTLLRDVQAARRSAGSSPIGVALQGERGVGKTHMLRWVRQQVQEQDGYFFLVKLFDSEDFWSSAVRGIVDGFDGGQVDQLGPLLRRLAVRAGLPPLQQSRIAGTIPVSRTDLDDLLGGLREIDRQVWADCQNTLRALVLFRAAEPEVQEIGYNYLNLDGDVEDAARAAWGFRPGARPKQVVLRDISRLLALTGPTVVAVDQIDGMLNLRSGPGTVDAATARRQDAAVGRIADGLMELRDAARRTLTVVACLPETWEMIATRAAISAADRFRPLLLQGAMPDAAVARTIVEQHLGGLYGEAGFTPRYPSWPVLPAAFERPAVRTFTPRKLLQQVDAHVRRCLDVDELRELADFGEPVDITGGGTGPGAEALRRLDERFAQLRAEADVAAPLDPDSEDQRIPALLAAGLKAYVAELGEGGQVLAVDQVRGRKPALHARLRRALDERTEDEVHLAFRAIAHAHHRAVQSRLAAAVTEAGLRAGADRRRLVLIRNVAWPSGPKTAAAVAEVHDLGGYTVPVGEDDLRTLAALEVMQHPPLPGLLEWLGARKPAGGTELFRRTLGDLALPTLRTAPDEARSPADRAADGPGYAVADGQTPVAGADGLVSPALAADRLASGAGADGLVPAPAMERRTPAPAANRPEPGSGPDRPAHVPAVDGPASPDPAAERAASSARIAAPIPPEPARRPSPFPRPRVPSVPVGRSAASGQDVLVPLEGLRKHTVVFAGSGSGKTVLLRRLVEECALQGVSAIVLDPNNDLARLGDAWPAPPEGWSDGDAARAEAYLEETDVAIWTPGRTKGRPLAFQPLPDFATVLYDEDEFRLAVDSAVASLVSRTRLTPRKLGQGQAVLREALEHFALDGGSSLGAFVEFLGALPDGISGLRNGPKLGAEMAEELHAATINDPLFGGAGQAVDPSVLLTPPPGKKARISVISFVGLQSDDQRQSFVNQLQMALFSWVKANPAGDRPLGGLFVMDEAQTFAPSGALTACTQSTISLASQARKYGLGLVFATQAPKGLHNRIPGNAATQFFGFLNSVAQINTATELARAKGGRVDDISRLRTGQFYVAGEGLAFEQVRTPMCLSFHPPSPPSAEEVIRRAAWSAD